VVIGFVSRSLPFKKSYAGLGVVTVSVLVIYEVMYLPVDIPMSRVCSLGMALIWPQEAQARISSLTVTFTSHLEEESGEKEQLDQYV